MNYLAGGRIRGTNTEMQPKFNDDFTSYADTTAGDLAYPTNDTAKLRVNPTNDVIDFNIVTDTTDDYIYHDLGIVSETVWVLRFKIRFSTLTSTGDAVMHIGLYDTAGGGGSTSQDGLKVKFDYTATKAFGIYTQDGATDNSDFFTQSDPYTIVVDTDYYCELKRTSSTTFIGTLYSDSTYTTAVSSPASGTTVSTVDGLRYLKIYNIITSGAGVIQGTIDDIKFFDGVSTAPSITFQSGSYFEQTDTNKHYIFGSGTTPWTQV